jgi:Phage major coat protein, Gp8
VGMFAQSIGEYGGLGSLGSTVQAAIYSLTAFVRDLTPTTWVVIAVVAVGLIVVLRR